MHAYCSSSPELPTANLTKVNKIIPDILCKPRTRTLLLLGTCCARRRLLQNHLLVFLNQRRTKCLSHRWLSHRTQCLVRKSYYSPTTLSRFWPGAQSFQNRKANQDYLGHHKTLSKVSVHSAVNGRPSTISHRKLKSWRSLNVMQDKSLE